MLVFGTESMMIVAGLERTHLCFSTSTFFTRCFDCFSPSSLAGFSRLFHMKYIVKEKAREGDEKVLGSVRL